MSNLQEKQLGQVRPTTNSPESIYSPGSNVTAIIKSIYVCNTSNIDSSFRILCDEDGTTYDESTALFWDVSIAAKTTVEINTFIALNNPSGNIAVRSLSGNDLTFTVFGAEITS